MSGCGLEGFVYHNYRLFVLAFFSKLPYAAFRVPLATLSRSSDFHGFRFVLLTYVLSLRGLMDLIEASAFREVECLCLVFGQRC